MNVHLTAIGCRLNEAELENWSRQFREQGHQLVAGPEQADLVVFNSCAVTQQAVRSSRQYVRRMKRSNPQAKMVISGCYATLDEKEAAAQLEVDLVVSNQHKDRLAEITAHALDIAAPEGYDGIEADVPVMPLFERGRQRAFVKIQDGCRHHCTYCIVTVARGEERSRTVQDIVDEVNQLVDNGVQEAVLTGVHVGGYGSDLGANLYQLVQHILEETDLPRLRFASVEPWDLPLNFFELFSNPRLMPHMHLPLQSGSDRILRQMARRCLTQDFAELVRQARLVVPDFNVTTDIIAGFPGETAFDWQETLTFVEQMNFGHIHIFSFSPREGTKAASFPNQVSGDVKRLRSQQLHDVARESKREVLERFVGQSCEVLWEGQGKPLADGMQRFSGYTRNYLRVHADVAEGLALSNRITPVILGPVDEVGDSMAAHLSPSVLDTLPKTSSFPTFWMRNVGK